ncbi:MAG: YCF48-related protein [Planctomycetota bacterium]
MCIGAADPGNRSARVDKPSHTSPNSEDALHAMTSAIRMKLCRRIHVRLPGRCALAALIAVVCSLTHAQQAVEQTPLQPSTSESVAIASRADASLNDVVALSADRLCAVGDCGTILLTENAGRAWTTVDTPTTDSLFAVCFSDSRNGLAVGGAIGRFTGISRATILRTSDGGETWERIENNLPLLRGLARSVDPESETNWICWGDFDPARATGVFKSNTMGQTWEATPAELGSTVACDLADAAAQSFLAWDVRNQSQLVHMQSKSPVTPRQMPAASKATNGVHNSGRSWIAYGRAGLLERSTNGHAWESVPLPLSPEARELLTWQGISQMGENLWVCGSPGSVLLHSNDFGQNWRKIELPNTLPLKQTAFVDANRGWAVGAHGTILATRDGGETWYQQRGAKSAGLVAISDRLESLSWDALGTHTWEAKRTSTALVIQDEIRRSDPSLNVGGISAQTVPSSVASSQSQLAALVGTYAPEIIIAPPDIAQQLYVLVSSNTGANAASGSDGSVSANALSEVGLSNALASVQKLVVPCNMESADFQDSTQRILKGVGVSTWDVLYALPPHLQNKRSSSGFKTLWCRSHNAAAKTSLVGGVVMGRDSDRNLSPKQLGNYQLVMGRVHRQKLLSQLQSTKLPPGDWNERLGFAIDRTPGSERSTQLWAMYHSLASNTEGWRQDFVLQQLATQADDHDASTWAMLQILRRVASSEVLHARTNSRDDESNSRAENTDATPVISAQFRTISDAETPWNASPFSATLASNSNEQSTQSQVVTAGATQSVPPLAPSSDLANRWFQLMGSFSQVEPRILTLPSMQMLDYRVALTRVPDGASEAQRLERLLESPLYGVWQRNALQELLMERSRYSDVKELLRGFRTERRPQLDGKLTEPLWTQTTAMRVPSDRPSRFSSPSVTGGESAKIRWAYDDAFLYAGIKCSPSGTVPPSAPKQRTYDADLSKLDHVEFHIDTNRDYATSFHFGVAANGETFDRCSDLIGYNPTWYVAVANEPDGSWSAEVAIAREALSKDAFREQTWGVAAVRVMGNSQTHESEATASAITSPHYLTFEPKVSRVYQPARVPPASQGRRISELPPLSSK